MPDITKLVGRMLNIKGYLLFKDVLKRAIMFYETTCILKLLFGPPNFNPTKKCNCNRAS
jgi:hypothetical protein